jgi:phosphotriesterase-related protein
VTTGAAVSVHLDPRGQGAIAAIDILESEGASPERLILAHLDSHPDLEYHLRVADRGVFIEYDHFGREYFAGHMDRPYTSDTLRIELLGALIERGYASQLLISHDICAKIDLAAFGGVGYDHILDAVLPRLRRAGIGADVIDQLLVDNPRRALSLPD